VGGALVSSGVDLDDIGADAIAVDGRHFVRLVADVTQR
jgi:hypothetical protein